MDNELPKSSIISLDPTCCADRALNSVDIVPSESTYHSMVRKLIIKLLHLLGLEMEELLVLQLFDVLVSESLAISITQKLPPLSLICGDATPLQFCINLSQDQGSVHELRYLTEVCKPGMLLPARTALAKEKVPKILKLIGAENLRSKIDGLLEFLLPQSRLLPDHPMLGIWFGVRHRKGFHPMLRLYFKLLWELGDPWIMSLSALNFVGISNLKYLEKVRRSLGTCCRPTCFGLDCSTEGFGKAKLYLRGYELTRLDILDYFESLGYGSFEREYAQFHRAFIGEQDSYVPRSVVLSIDLSINESPGIKVEIGPRYYVKDDLDVYKHIRELAHQLSFDTIPYEQVLNLISESKLIPGCMHYHDVVGIGYDPIKGPRLTIYLRPYLRRYNCNVKESC